MGGVPGGFTLRFIMSDAVGILDGLVARVLGTYPFRFTLAVDESDRVAAYRIRAAVVSQSGWAVAPSPAGLERDEFDDEAVQVMGWDGAEPVCTGRLVLPPGPLPTERACGIVVEPVGGVVDVGRMAVAHSRQNVEHALFVALLCRLYLEMRDRGFEVACGMMSRSARRLVRLLGLRLDVLGPEREYWGQMRAPVRFELMANAEPISRRWA
jgi:N-acyl-L-homoserine lactone synthetase